MHMARRFDRRSCAGEQHVVEVRVEARLSEKDRRH
jgi:hypothetical protein